MKRWLAERLRRWADRLAPPAEPMHPWYSVSGPAELDLSAVASRPMSPEDVQKCILVRPQFVRNTPPEWTDVPVGEIGDG